jgi:hypothetical protein
MVYGFFLEYGANNMCEGICEEKAPKYNKINKGIVSYSGRLIVSGSIRSIKMYGWG